MDVLPKNRYLEVYENRPKEIDFLEDALEQIDGEANKEELMEIHDNAYKALMAGDMKKYMGYKAALLGALQDKKDFTT